MILDLLRSYMKLCSDFNRFEETTEKTTKVEAQFIYNKASIESNA